MGAKLIQLTLPGVPDVYRGTEVWENALVDPDNRRPVDFEVLSAALARLEGGGLPTVAADGAAKLLVTTRALRLRRDRPGLFCGYQPLYATGDAADHLIAFDRGGAITLATRLPIGLRARGGWPDTEITLPDGSWHDVLTGGVAAAGRVPLRTILDRYPVALLVRP